MTKFTSMISENPFEGPHDIAYALVTNEDSGNPNNPQDPRHYVEITLTQLSQKGIWEEI